VPKRDGAGRVPVARRCIGASRGGRCRTGLITGPRRSIGSSQCLHGRRAVAATRTCSRLWTSPSRTGPACNMQHTACNVQHTACNVQHTACNVQRATYSMQHTTYDIQNETYNIHRATCSMKHTTSRNEKRATYIAYRATSNVQHTTCNIQHTARHVQHRTFPNARTRSARSVMYCHGAA
jgi:hypothetical protein